MHKVPELIGAAEAAKLLGIDRSRLTRKVQDGTVPYVHKGDGIRGAYLFDRAVIETLAKGQAA